MTTQPLTEIPAACECRDDCPQCRSGPVAWLVQTPYGAMYACDQCTGHEGFSEPEELDDD